MGVKWSEGRAERNNAISGAGGNRTLVRRVVARRATTIPVLVAHGCHAPG